LKDKKVPIIFEKKNNHFRTLFFHKDNSR